jgi:hypothetical protein
MMSVLEMSEKWLECGFLDEAGVRILYDRFQDSDDKNQEHYRFSAFLGALKSADLTNSPDFAENYLGLATIDPDQTMARGALESLLESPVITTAQNKAFQGRPEFSDRYLQRAADRRLIFEALHKITANHELCPSLFSRCLISNDAYLQRLLLEAEGITLNAEQLATLAKDGAARALRNIAASQLKRASTL